MGWVESLPRQMADHLVEGVVAADILPHDQDVAIRPAEGSSMHRAGRLIEGLARGQRFQRPEQRFLRQFRGGGEGRELGQGFLDSGEPANAAARLAGNGAAPLGEAPGMFFFQADIDPDPGPKADLLATLMF